jgi:glutathione peroxidase
MFSFLKKKRPSFDPHCTAYEFSFQTIDGEPLPFSAFRDKAVLVVNTASRCGFTKQYEGLQNLYDRFKPHGLVVLGVPSNDFGAQEQGTNGEIKTFCSSIFHITFPMTEKTAVSGDEAHPFYQWAAAQKKGGMIFSRPRWNFHKYLVAPNGLLADSFGSQVVPEDLELISSIEATLSYA